MSNVTVDDIRVDDGSGDPTTILDSAALAARVRLVDASGNAVNPAAPVTQPVTVVDGGDVAQGAKSDAAVTDPAASGSVVALLKGVLTRLATLVTGVNQGTKTATLSNAWPVAPYAADGSVLSYQGGEVMAANTWGAATVGRASSTTPTSVTTGDAVKPWMTLQGADVIGYPFALSSDTGSVAQGGSLSASGNTVIPGAAMALYNDGAVDWQRARNNVAGTLLASAARTTTTSSADQTNYNGQAVAVTFNITAVPGVETLTLTIEAKDPVSGTYTTLLTGVAQSGTGTTRLRVGTNITASANVAAADVLGRTWRVTVTHSAAGSFTYSVGFDVVTA